MCTLKVNRGWLKNEARKKRRDRMNTFTNDDCQMLINTIEKTRHYISDKLPQRYDKLMRLRDKALIAMAQTFFKRGSEVLSLRRENVDFIGDKMFVSFSIAKKQKRVKFCTVCDTKNGFRSSFCKKCGESLAEAETKMVGEPMTRTKQKSLNYLFVDYVLNWIEVFDEICPNGEEPLLFPPLQVSFNSAFFKFFNEKPMTVQNFDNRLQRLDPTMTSSFFRYGGAEKYLSLGYTPHQLKEIGDWDSSKMPELYAAKKGLTPAQKRWSEDLR